MLLAHEYAEWVEEHASRRAALGVTTQNDDLLLGQLVRALDRVPGIRAIVLGGSRARAEATAQSDYDIGLYYEAENPIDIGRLAEASMLLPGAASASITAIGEWRPWINGGTWLTVEGNRVDLLYRDLGKVRGAIEACQAGGSSASTSPATRTPSSRRSTWARWRSAGFCGTRRACWPG